MSEIFKGDHRGVMGDDREGKSGEVKRWDTLDSWRIAALACLSICCLSDWKNSLLPVHDLHFRETPLAPWFRPESSPGPHTNEKEPPFVPAKPPQLEISQMCFTCSGYSLAAAGYNSFYLSGLNTVHQGAEYETRHIMKIIWHFPVTWIG